MKKKNDPFRLFRNQLFDDPKHWHSMTDGERVLYTSYHGNCEWTGKLRGICMMTDIAMCKYLRWKPSKLYHYKAVLKSKGYITSSPGRRGVVIHKYDKKQPLRHSKEVRSAGEATPPQQRDQKEPLRHSKGASKIREYILRPLEALKNLKKE